MANFEKKPENERDLERLCEWLSGLGKDLTVSWVEVQQATGVKMDTRGKDLVRKAITKRIGREYHPIRGSGFRLDGPETALEIAGGHNAKIFGAVGRAKKASSRVSVYRPEMNQADRQQLDMQSSMLDVITAPVKALKKIAMGRTEPMLPKI